MPEPVKHDARYMPGLDGLRALAVAAVFVYHLGFGWAAGGLLGVGVFFTLSGYLITDLLLAQLDGGGVRLRAFWGARARRLLPGLLVMLAVVAAWVALLGPGQPPQFARAIAAAAFYVSNWQLIFQHVSYFARFGPPSPLSHLWSLGVEEQFYLLWPLLLIAGVRFVPERSRLTGMRPRLAALTLLLAAGSAVEMAVLYRPSLDPSRVYFGTDTRAFALLAGAGLAMVWPSRHLRANITAGARRVCDAAGVLGLVTIALLVWRTNEYSPFLYRGGFVLLAFATVLVVAALVHPAGRLGRVLGAGALRWIGVRSYGIYLWHVPILALTTPAADHGVQWWRDALQVTATICVAALSWRFIEQPVRHGVLGRAWQRLRHARWREWTVTRRSAAALSATLVLLALAGGALAEASHGHTRHPSPAEPDTQTPRRSRTATSPTTTTTTSTTAASLAAAPGSARTSCRAVVDIGDSTSEGLLSPDYLPNPALRIEAQYIQVGVGIQHYAISGARSIIETYEGQPNGLQVAQGWKHDGYHGCWVLALGTNDTADVYVGSNVGRLARIKEMMATIGNQPVMWVNVKSLLDSGPYSEQNMQLWNQALLAACQEYPNMRVFDWASAAKDAWFISDGIHYNTPGYQARSHLIAQALARAFPDGRTHGQGCLVS